MIKNIIFDFGDIFIDLDKLAPFKEMARFGFTSLTPEFDTLAKKYEMGLLTTTEFLNAMQSTFPSATKEQLKKAWNSIILSFPEYRLQFIEELKKQHKYRLFLLSNTNALHIEQVQETMGMKDYNRFKNCFEKFYLSHKIKMRKPDAAIYKFVLDENRLLPKETFFVDDTEENTQSAAKLGIKTWNLNVGAEDIIQLRNFL